MASEARGRGFSGVLARTASVAPLSPPGLGQGGSGPYLPPSLASSLFPPLLGFMLGSLLAPFASASPLCADSPALSLPGERGPSVSPQATCGRAEGSAALQVARPAVHCPQDPGKVTSCSAPLLEQVTF